MLRLAVVRLCEAGIVPVMFIHDGILFEETDDEKLAHAKEIMLKAGRDVCDFEIGVDANGWLVGVVPATATRTCGEGMWGTVHGCARLPLAWRQHRVGKTYYVVVHGKRILVEELDTGKPPSLVAGLDLRRPGRKFPMNAASSSLSGRVTRCWPSC